MKKLSIIIVILSILASCAQTGSTPEKGKNTNEEQTNVSSGWNDSFLLGDEKIDKQHQEVYEKTNELIELCKEESDFDKLFEMLGAIVNHTVQHFADEEALQLACNFPEYESHKKIHTDFIATATELVKKLETSRSVEELANALNNTVLPWVINHIQEEDLKISESIKKNTENNL